MPFKHLIYGTFPDLPGSQQVIYRSGDLADEVVDWLIVFYNDFGDCKNSEFTSSLSVCWDESESVGRLATITKVSQQGRDFSGRWGALLRHTIILNEADYQQYLFDPEQINSLFIASGSSEKLSQFVEPVAPEPDDLDTRLEKILAIDFENYRDSLCRILFGERLELYAEINNEHTNKYLSNLLCLLPLNLRRHLNWSEFLFRCSEQFDFSVCYSPRYDAAEAGRLSFISAGDNHLKAANLDSRWADQYLSDLETSFHDQNKERMRGLIASEYK